MAFDDKKVKYLKNDLHYTDKEVADMLADLDQRGKDYEATQAEFKDFADPTEPPASVGDKELNASFKALLPDLIGADAENAAQNLTLAKAVKTMHDEQAAMAKTLKQIKAAYDQRPKRASEAEETELDEDDEKDAAIIGQIQHENADAKAAKAFPGLYNFNFSIDKAARAQFGAHQQQEER